MRFGSFVAWFAFLSLLEASILLRRAADQSMPATGISSWPGVFAAVTFQSALLPGSCVPLSAWAYSTDPVPGVLVPLAAWAKAFVIRRAMPAADMVQCALASLNMAIADWGSTTMRGTRKAATQAVKRRRRARRPMRRRPDSGVELCCVRGLSTCIT